MQKTGTSIKSRALPGPGFWGGGWGHRAGGPAQKIRGDTTSRGMQFMHGIL